jgi:hypothetical protein
VLGTLDHLLMPKVAIHNGKAEQLLKRARNVLRESDKLVQETEHLMKQSRELMRDFHFSLSGPTQKSKPCVV